MGEFNRGPITLSAAYTKGTNHNFDGSTRTPNGYYVEGGFNFNEDTTLFARYDSFDYDLAAKKTGITFGLSKKLKQVGSTPRGHAHQ